MTKHDSRTELSHQGNAAAIVVTIVTLLIFSFRPLYADSWQLVEGEAIGALLSGQDVTYEGRTTSSQSFHIDGTTTFVEGLGNWKFNDTQYCSQWPPSKNWSCYQIYVDATGKHIRFTNNSDEEWIGVFN